MESVNTSGNEIGAEGRSLLILTALAALVLVVPLLWMRPPWFVVWAIVFILPHALIATRVYRSPLDRAGPALAFGVCTVMIVLGALLTALQWDRLEWLPLAYSLALVAVYAVLLKVAVAQYRRGTSAKPHWRLLARGFADALMYYTILFVIVSGASMHLD